MLCFVLSTSSIICFLLGLVSPGRINVSKVISIKARILEPRSAARLGLFPDSAAPHPNPKLHHFWALRNLRLTLGTTSVFLGILLQIYSPCFLLPSIAPVNSNGPSIHQISTASSVVLINSWPVIGQSVGSRTQPFSKWRDSDKDHR
jgi:hypothetical protein